MGVLNVTPDSFSDGGRFFYPTAAMKRGLQLVEEGADVVDVGGESTRPGSDPVSAEEEAERVVSVIERLAAETDVPISIDTRKPAVADAAVHAGATIVNDVSGGRDPEMFGVVARHGVGMVLMHMLGEPKTMQENPTYEDVVAEVREYLNERLEAAILAGIRPEALAIDPGIGFGKTLEHNLLLLRDVGVLARLGRPVVVGPSRKHFIGELLDADVEQRLEGTIGAAVSLAWSGAHVVRVHDVREVVRALRVADAIRGAPDPTGDEVPAARPDPRPPA